MSTTFVPFVASTADIASSPAGSRPKIVTEPEAARAFRPIAERAAQNAGQTEGEPKVSLERDGDRVTRIKIECSCGHLIELDCT